MTEQSAPFGTAPYPTPQEYLDLADRVERREVVPWLYEARLLRHAAGLFGHGHSCPCPPTIEIVIHGDVAGAIVRFEK